MPDVNPTIPPMPYNSSSYSDGTNTVNVYVTPVATTAPTITIDSYSEVDPYSSGSPHFYTSAVGYNYVIYYYGYDIQVSNTRTGLSAGVNPVVLHPNFVTSDGNNNAIGLQLYILFYSDTTYRTNQNWPDTLPSNYNPGVGSNANPGGVQLGCIITILPCTEPLGLGLTPQSNQDTQVSLSWSAPSDTGGVAITDYVVQYSTDQSAWTTVSHQPSSATSITVTGLTNDTLYYFKVAAVNQYCNNGGPGSGPFSQIINATPSTVPGAPTGLTAASNQNTQSTLSWTAPTSDGGLAITDYVVQYSTDQSAWTTFTHLPSASQTITVTGLINGTPYYFQVAAVNANPNSPGPYSTTANATPSTVPGAPTGLTAASNQNAQVQLNWTAPTSDGGLAITDYVVQYSTDQSAWTTFTHLPSASQTITVTGLINGTPYYFQVAAVNANPNSPGPYSTTANATPSTVPGAPT